MSKSNQLAALSRLFSSTVFRELAINGKSAIFARLARESGLLDLQADQPQVRDLFDAAFDVLKRRGARNEYVYRAALTRRVLMGRHSLQTASMLNEFRVGTSKADVVILNGTSTVYEIKSERDSLSRLERQIQNYRKVFANVFVIAGENHVDDILSSIPEDVGVMSLDHRCYISTRREAKNDPGRICPLTIFESLRTNEAKALLAELGISMPEVPNTLVRDELRNRFARLRAEDAHSAMLSVLKRTRNLQRLSNLIDSLPVSLQAIALSVPLRKADHVRVVDAVNTPLKFALTWG